MTAVAIALFDGEGTFLRARTRAIAAGHRIVGEWTPYASTALDSDDGKKGILPAVLAGGAIGGLGLFAIEVWTSVAAYPLDSGGRALFSWPAFIPVTFELGVLTAVLVGIVAFLWRAGLPRYDHPAFASPRFARASTDRFFLWLPATPEWRALLATTEAEAVEEVRA